jgi:hypothetical protein
MAPRKRQFFRLVQLTQLSSAHDSRQQSAPHYAAAHDVVPKDVAGSRAVVGAPGRCCTVHSAPDTCSWVRCKAENKLYQLVYQVVILASVHKAKSSPCEVHAIARTGTSQTPRGPTSQGARRPDCAKNGALAVTPPIRLGQSVRRPWQTHLGNPPAFHRRQRRQP